MSTNGTSSIGVVTLVLGEEYEEAVTKGTISKRDYCDKHGYAFHYGTEHLLPELPASWSKLPLMDSLLGEHDVLLFLDADTVVMNSEITLESIIEEHFPRDKSLCLVRDCCDNLNTGVILLRCDETARKLLRAMSEQLQFAEHDWWENMAFIHLHKREAWVRAATRVLDDYRILHSYPAELHDEERGYNEGDFVIHFAGLYSLPRLAEFMNYYCERRA